MKKIISSLLLINSMFMLASCSSNKDIIKINLSNYSTYIDTTKTSKNTIGNRFNYTITLSGVLSFAVYENVNVSLQVRVYKDANNQFNVQDKNNVYFYSITLNAAGNGSATLYDNGYIENKYNTNETALEYYSVEWSVKDIEGKIILYNK